MYFEGTNSALGCTILLSGPLDKEREELKKVKLALRDMLKLTRNVVLERHFLMQLNCVVPSPSVSLCDHQHPSDTHPDLESPFLIRRNILNRQTLVLSKVIIKKGIVSALQLGII